MEADVMVLGLGPAGASAAAEAARRGCKVIALDRKREAGVPVQCAELVPQMFPVHAGAIRQHIQSMSTFVEDDAPDVKSDFPGRMLDRAAFDASLVEEARRAGAQIRFSSLVKDISVLKARVIIGADGPRSRAGKAIGSVNRELVETRQITVGLKAPYSATDIFLSADIPGGYGWLFPKGELANLGAGVSAPHKGRLKSILAQLHAALSNRKAGTDPGSVPVLGSEILMTTGGAIPVGGMLKPWGVFQKTVVLLAGDAAGLANPVTGAGIAAAVHSGRLAGQAAATGKFQEYEDELEDVYRAALDRALARRRELLSSSMQKNHLRRSWIAYPEYWQ